MVKDSFGKKNTSLQMLQESFILICGRKQVQFRHQPVKSLSQFIRKYYYLGYCVNLKNTIDLLLFFS